MEKKNIFKAIVGGAAVIGGGIAIAKALFNKKHDEEVSDPEVETDEVVETEEE